MGFQSVYSMLIDVFPQVDNRILRAVAIENSKDADKAVEVVLMEVIPNITSTSGFANDSPDSIASNEDDTICWDSENLDDNVGLFKVSSPNNGNGSGDQVCESNEKQTIFPTVNGHMPSIMGLSAALNCEDVLTNLCVIESNKLSSSVNSLDLNTSPVKLNDISVPSESTDEKSVILNCEDVSSNVEALVESKFQQLRSNGHCLDLNTSAMNCITFTEVDNSENEPNKEKSNLEVVAYVHEPIEENSANELVSFELEPTEEKSNHEQVAFEHEGVEDISTREVVEFEDEHSLKTKVSRSGNICRIDLLEDIIERGRDNKKTLFKAMESVISLMREVEVREKKAEQVKEEAARGPVDILANVEDLKQMLQHAREANDMHAGEVYGEKAILATEVKELQSRLLCLSDERDNSLAILDNMRPTLEQRLNAAEKEMKGAEQEKMEKETCARRALAEQKQLMDKLVQEAKILKQEAEENSKLQEFLIDRGRVVDMLQGEIAVICQDVKLLKQKFDERVPLSESLSSSQTSCRSASSSSYLKNLALAQVPLQIETALGTRISPTPSISSHLSSGEEREAYHRDTQVDDDEWEFFDRKELNI